MARFAFSLFLTEIDSLFLCLRGIFIFSRGNNICSYHLPIFFFFLLGLLAFFFFLVDFSGALYVLVWFEFQAR